MSRKKRLLCILLALAVVIGGVCCWQRNNLRALGMSMKLSQDELSGKMNQQQERTEEASRQAGVTVRALTDEEKAELHGSEVSREELIDLVADARPDILGHNIETVRRLTPQVRSRAKYEVSLRTLAHIARRGLTAKSGLMVGLGETDSEVLEAVDDLVEAGVQILTIGQYLRPSLRHLPVAEYVTPEKFAWYKEQALARGLRYVESGPMVRSSYMAEKAMRSCRTPK